MEELRTFFGTPRFQVRRRLGAGGMGVVYEARDLERDAHVALKTLHTQDPHALLRFKNEFRLVQDVQHPNLVRLGELFEHGGTWFFTMELVDGVSFLEHVRPPESAVDLDRLHAALVQLVKGLRALHDARKVHRDVKPSNVLVTPSGRVVVLDFGVMSDDAAREPWDDDDEFVGTFAYMAPEQARGEAVGPEADFYAVGVMLYQALTGALPIAGRAADLLAEKQLVEPIAPSKRARGVPPELERLCMELLRIEPHERPSAGEILRRLGVSESAPPRAVDEVPFVGRANELGFLQQAMDDVRGGATVTVCVHGESGVGKSAVVAEFAERARRRAGVLVLRSRCYERESVPYKAIDGVIDATSRYLATLDDAEVAPLVPEDAGLLADAFPVVRRVAAFARVRGPDGDAAIDPPTRRARLFAAVRALLCKLAAGREVVVTIDDLQWADDDGLALLAWALRPPDAPRVLLVATLRDAAGAGFEATLRRLPGEVRQVGVTGLPASDARQLAALLLGTDDSAASARIAKEAAGHPLFIDELVRGRLALDEKTPLRLEEALGARVARLDDGARAVLEAIAVAGGPIEQGVIASAVGTGDAFDVIGRLRGDHLVRTTGARPADVIEAYHERIRQAVLARIDPAARSSIHERLARGLEARGSKDVEALFVHWRGAKQHGKATEYAARAADEAARVLAFDRAARLYRAALELGPERPDATAIRTRLAESLANAGRGVEAAEVFRRAADGASEEQALDLRRRAADELLRAGHVDAGLAEIRAVLATLGARYPESPRAALVSLLWTRAVVRLRGLGFTQRTVSEITPHELTRIDTCWSIAAGLAITDTVRGADFQSRGLLLALRAGEPYRVARALAVESGFSAASGVPARARTVRLLAAADTLARSLGHPHALALVASATGMAAYLEGRWRDAGEALDRASTMLLVCPGASWEMHTSRLYALIALAYRGEMLEIQRRLPAHLSEAVERGNIYAATTLRTMLNMAWLAEGEPERARAELVQSTKDWTRNGFHLQHYWTLFAEGQLELHAGHGAEVHRALEERWGALEESLLLRIQVVNVEALQLRARAAIAAAAAPGADAGRLRAMAERVARAIAKEGMPHSAPFAALLLAGIAAGRGEFDGAVARLREALAGFDGEGMGLYGAATRKRLGAIVKGEEGGKLVAEADEWMEARRVRTGERLVAMVAPGFGDDR